MFADWLQYRWDLLITTWFDNNLFAMAFYGTLGIVYCMFWTVGLFYLFVDITGRPGFLIKYKIQEPYTPISKSVLLDLIGQVLFNQIVVMVPLFYLLARALEWRQIPTGQLPSLARIVADFIGFVAVNEIGFYYTHRLVHYGPLYRLIQDHRWQAPVAISSFYCHPIEHVFSNIMPVFMGPFVMNSHILIQWLWYGTAVFVSLTHHSGYHFPCMISSEYHDYHHLKFNQNFGTIGLLDWIHGTNNEFYKSIAYKRHRVFMSCQSIKQLYPDESQNITIVNCMYWTVGLFYLFVDMTGRPGFLLKYKIQESYTPISKSVLLDLIGQVLFNQILVMVPSLYLLSSVFEWRQFPTGQLPSLARIVADFIVFVFVMEIFQYYTHRLLHYGPLYRLVHKRHHRWQTPVAISSLYCHPIELMFNNTIPVFMGPFLMKSHILTQWLWYGFIIFVTLADHSGYHFPCMISTEYHYYYHLNFTQNLGAFGLLDWIHGTGNEFYKSMAYKRHRFDFHRDITV
ncbi:fatty acid hydroxylase domain-containing protein 2-like [Oppia nitens]|uniref:fatty acid hydroxylase domain-containing protein 2-like n=1 Tax=Oppia nitens TaxID=1686743 RepID=UPI0023DBBC29|nr:fatty acid hydroxylase domain-containing protein 2-like [Oppia nitens]